MLDAWVLVVDCCILTWLIATWFYEGHHKRCTVKTQCFKCGSEDTRYCLSEEE
jgi:hypothetical protein